MKSLNRRLLIVDDEQTVRAHIVTTLQAEEENTDALDQAAAALFGADESPPKKPAGQGMQFDIVEASSGFEAVEIVAQAVRDFRPFATIFCDMCMPGMDGLETVKKIRAIDPRVDVVIITAYTDYAPTNIMESLGANISYLSKPFSSPDLFQMAARSVLDWNKVNELENFIEKLVGLDRFNGEIDLLRHLTAHLADIYDIEDLAVVCGDLSRKQVVVGEGRLSDAAVQAQVLNELSPTIGASDNVPSRYVVQPLLSYGYLVLPDVVRRCNAHQSHLAKVMIEYTGMALNNIKLREDLDQKQKMAQIGKTASHISHDIRAPIALANMLVNSMALGDVGAQVTEKSKKVISVLNQAENMANDILLFANHSLHIEPTKCRISSFVNRHQDLWAAMAAYNRAQFSVEILADLEARVEIDQGRLARAINNLVKNAAEAVQNIEAALVKVVLAEQSDGLCIRVIDNGDGIPPHVLDKIYQPFVSTSKAHGSGFGLAIAKEIVELHQGELRIESSDSGTCCALRLPWQQSSAS